MGATARIVAVTTVPLMLAALAGCGGSSQTDSGKSSGSTTSSSSSSTSSGNGGAGGGAATTSSTTGVGGAGGAGGAGAGGEGGAGGSCVPAPETCNGVDDDCNGQVDDGDPGGGADCMTGLKGICAVGHEHCIQGVVSCVPDHGPGEVAETCNGLDDDCNGLIDEGLPTQSYYKDDDGDGFGTQATIQACSEPDGYAAKSGDCNDNNANIYPGAIELCNDADDNCNGFVDEGVQKPTFYKDNDADGYGGVTSILACSAPMGYVDQSGDCNDFNPTIHPTAAEACNDLDDDCNGLIDDGVPTQTIYKDNDGDGFAPLGALTQKKCDVPVGWALPQDVNGDNQPDWDCNDSDVTVYPAAPTMCDGKDNDCDGVVDRLCFTACAGTWPVQPSNTAGGVEWVSHADLDGNGKQEILFQSDSAFAIVDSTGKVLEQEGGGLNYSRGQALVADIDGYDQFSAATQSLEVLTGNTSKLTYYKLSGGTVSKITSNLDVYDASPMMATDVDHDGVVEVFTTSWCSPTQGTRIFRYDRNANAMTNVVDIADPDGTCEYTDGRFLADLDGDGQPELVFGNGYANPQTPAYWNGHVFAEKFTNPSTLSTASYCAPGTCFPSAVNGLFLGGVASMFHFGAETRSQIAYFADQVPGAAATWRFWDWDISGQPDANSPSTNSTYWVGTNDIDADGVPDNSGADVAYLGLFDVDGDGYPDRIVATGTSLDVQLYDPGTKSFKSNPGSAKSISATNVKVGTLWDIDGSGRLAVLSTDASHNLYCHQLGPQTWQKSAILPPHFTTYLRTYQWDNYEPNEGADTNADGMPDQIVRVPSALTTKGDFYGYISSPTDKDYYLIDGAWGGPICVTSPKVATYTMKVFSFADKLPPAGPDGKIWEDSSSAVKKCFYPGNLLPSRNGEYRFIVGIESQGTASPFWPYWISAPK